MSPSLKAALALLLPLLDAAPPPWLEEFGSATGQIRLGFPGKKDIFEKTFVRFRGTVPERLFHETFKR
jgi:hypothetical protein